LVKKTARRLLFEKKGDASTSSFISDLSERIFVPEKTMASKEMETDSVGGFGYPFVE
jgi:hypothetical protein